VREDRKAQPIEYSPCRKLAKALRGDGELTAFPWMRPNRVLVETPNRHIEQGVRLASKPLSGTEFVRIKIDVGVKASEFVHPAKIVSPARRSRAGAGTALHDNAVVQNRS
jgi:hypothetical protein